MTTPTRPSIPPVAPSAAPTAWPQWLASIARTVNLLLGRIGTATVTLAAGATTTSLYDSRLGYFSSVHLTAQTATAAAASGLYVTTTTGQATIHHDSTADLDRTFAVTIVA